MRGFSGQVSRASVLAARKNKYLPPSEVIIHLPPGTRTTFDKDELNLIRQWFNVFEDVAPEALEAADLDLMEKIAKAGDFPFRRRGRAKKAREAQEAPSGETGEIE